MAGKDPEKLVVKWVRTDSLIPYARNARLHSPAQIAQISASIKEFGWTSPILTDGASGVIAGHGRLMAAQLLKADTVPTIDLAHLSETQKRAYVIADNRIALNSTWDDEMLGLELAELKAGDFDLALTGFSDEEIEGMVAGGGSGDGGGDAPDDFPTVDESLATEFQCPKCQYQWSGKPK